MKPTKQTVYLPVKVEDELPNQSTNYHVNLRYNGCSVEYFDSLNNKFVEEDVIEWLKPQEAFVFTPEQLNEYTANVVRQALETAAEKAEIEQKGYFEATPEECLKGVEIYDDNGSDRPSFIAFVNKQSITNTFEETFKKFEV